MNVLVVGANGKVARELVKKLSADTNHHVTAMLRKEEQASVLKELGADQTVIADLETDISQAFDGIDAVVFAAGSGGHTGGDKTILIDLWGARKTVDEAKKHGVKRFVMLSSLRSEDPEAGPVQIRHYLVAKRLADEYVEESGLDYTIVRPGMLTNDVPKGTVQLKEHIGDDFGEITRADVAHVIAETLDKKNSYGKSLDLLGGDTPIADAVASI